MEPRHPGAPGVGQGRDQLQLGCGVPASLPHSFRLGRRAQDKSDASSGVQGLSIRAPGVRNGFGGLSS